MSQADLRSDPSRIGRPTARRHARLGAAHPSLPSHDLLKLNWKDLIRELYHGADGRYLYRPICKCATTTIKALLLEYEGLPVDANLWRLHQKSLNSFPGIDHLPANDILEILSERVKTFKFTFVRNPFDRMASAYKDKVLRQDAACLDRLTATGPARGRRSAAPLSFEDFILLVIAQDFSDMDPHWRPQYYEGAFEIIRYDAVGRLETLERDLCHVFGRIGGSSAWIADRLTRLNATGAIVGLWDQVSARTIDAFVHRYGCDFVRFGYDPSLGSDRGARL